MLLNQTRSALGVSSKTLSAEIDDIPSDGVVDAHVGDSPRNRGNARQAGAVLQEEPHLMSRIQRIIVSEVDSGAIIVKRA